MGGLDGQRSELMLLQQIDQSDKVDAASVFAQSIQVNEGRILLEKAWRFRQLCAQCLAHRLQISGLELKSHQRQVCTLDVVRGDGGGRNGHV